MMMCEIELRQVHETPMAVKFMDTSGREFWFPRSQIKTREIQDGLTVVTLPVTLAEQKGVTGYMELDRDDVVINAADRWK